MSAEAYWIGVRETMSELATVAATRPLQPKAGLPHPSNAATKRFVMTGEDAIYMRSKRNRKHPAHVEGRICLMNYKIAAMGVMDELHELATDEEIAAYQAGEALKVEAIQGGAALLRQSKASFTPPVPVRS
jgi:hypothetical protein